MSRLDAAFHPMVSVLYIAGLLLFIMWLSHPLYLLTALGSALLLNFMGDGGRILQQSWRGMLLLGGVVLLLNPLFSGRGATILFYFRNRPVTKESILYGAVFALMLVTMLVAFQAGRQLLSTDQFLYLAGSILPRTAVMLVMVMRLMPLLKRRMEQISLVSKTLGEPSCRRRIGRIRTAMRQLNTLLVWTLEESLHTAVAMRASGYGTGQRSSYIPYRMAFRDWQGFFLLLTLGGWVMMGAWQGAGRMGFYPLISGMTLSPLHYIAYTLWCMLPILTDLGERIRWQAISWNK